MGNKSFVLEYLITTSDNTIHTIGTSIQVMFDTKTKQTIPIPSWLKEEVLSYEKEGTVSMKS
jgi:acyl-CoA thioester hydrolase